MHLVLAMLPLLFYKLNAMPIPFHPQRLDEGDEILQTFENNKATYHESCMPKFKTTKLERNRKSLCKTKEDDAPSAKFIRSSQKAGEEDAEESKTEKKESALFVTNQRQS